MTEMTQTTEPTHEHCWHHLGMQRTSYPPQDLKRCCHCGEEAWISAVLQLPSGHGPFCPPQVGGVTGHYKITIDRTASCPCRPENGGSGVCGCTLSGPTFTAGG